MTLSFSINLVSHLVGSLMTQFFGPSPTFIHIFSKAISERWRSINELVAKKFRTLLGRIAKKLQFS